MPDRIVEVRRAAQTDLGALVSLYDELADGEAAAAPGDRESAAALLEDVLADPRRELVVAALDGRVVGTADLLFVPNLTHRGGPWAIVENVIVAGDARRRGVGRALMEDVIGRARGAGCYKLQLISGKHRAEAHALYRSLGLDAVGEGFKIYFER